MVVWALERMAGYNNAAQSCIQFCLVAILVLQDKIPLCTKSISPINHHYKRDVFKTVHRSPLTANKVNYDSSYHFQKKYFIYYYYFTLK